MPRPIIAKHPKNILWRVWTLTDINITTRVVPDGLIIEGGIGHGSITIDLENVIELGEILRTFGAADRRRSFRIPIDWAPLNVEIMVEEKKIEAKAIDISLLGLFVECDGEELSVGSEVDVHLELDGITVVLPSIVRRQVESNFGIEFVDVMDAGALETPVDFRRMISSLKLDYVRNLRTLTSAVGHRG